MDVEARNDPYFAPGRARRGRPGSRLREAGTGLIVLGMVAFLVWTLIQAPDAALQAARRAQCGNNLKQIGIALNAYREAHGHLPPAATFDANGRPLHSWRTLILPYLEQYELYQSIDLDRPWDDPANARARATRVDAYRCPSRPDPGNTTTYLASCGPDAAFAPRDPRPLAAITDPLHATLAVVEAGPADAVPWMQPADADAALLARLAASPTRHGTGRNALFVDGSTRYFKKEPPAPVLRAIVSIAGGETPDLDQD